MALPTAVRDELTVAGGFTDFQIRALDAIFEAYETRIAALEVLAASFGDLSAADANDTLVADAQGVYQVNAVV